MASVANVAMVEVANDLRALDGNVARDRDQGMMLAVDYKNVDPHHLSRSEKIDIYLDAVIALNLKSVYLHRLHVIKIRTIINILL